MKSTRSQSGFAAAEALLVTAVLAVVGFIVYTNYSTKQAVDTEISTVPSAPAIETEQDLVTAEQTIDSIDLDSDNDAAELDAALATF
jgi:hypothetical protein